MGMMDVMWKFKENMLESMVDWGEAVTREAYENTPVLTGNLSRSWFDPQQNISADGDTLRLVLGNMAKNPNSKWSDAGEVYSGKVEEGLAPYPSRKAKYMFRNALREFSDDIPLVIDVHVLNYLWDFGDHIQRMVGR